MNGQMVSSLVILALLIFPAGPCPASGGGRHSAFEIARENGLRAGTALTLAHRFLRKWTERRDPENALIPGGPTGDRWTLRETATRLYPQLVLASWLTDRELFNGRLRETLRDEIRLTSRVMRLPDDYSLSAGRFLYALPDTGRIRMSATGYAAEGLAAITGLVGPDIWSERAQAIVDDLLTQAPYIDGSVPSGNVEINGKLLLVLPQLAGYTGDSTYLEWARRIADVYCFGILPENGGLPARLWDFGAGKARNADLPLDDTGIPIVKGLAVLFAQETALGTSRSERYRPVLSRMFNVLLTHARTPEGLFYARIEPDRGNGYSVDRKNRTPAWPGLLASALVFGRAAENTTCIRPVQEALSRIPEAHTRLWGNRPEITARNLPDILALYAYARRDRTLDNAVFRDLLAWVDREMEGLLEDFDTAVSNPQYAEDEVAFAGAALAYAWFKTAGVHTLPWQEDLSLGARVSGDTLFVSLQAESPWQGRMIFDIPRHREYAHLAEPYPIDHGFPEWFAVKADGYYGIRISGAGGSAIWSGALLRSGLRAALKAGETREIRIVRLPEPPLEHRPVEPETPQTQQQPPGSPGLSH